MFAEPVDQRTGQSGGQFEKLIGEDQRRDARVEENGAVRFARHGDAERFVRHCDLVIGVLCFLLHFRHGQWHFVTFGRRIVDLHPEALRRFENQIDGQERQIVRHVADARFVQLNSQAEIRFAARLNGVGAEILRVVTVGHVDVSQGASNATSYARFRFPAAAAFQTLVLRRVALGITVESGAIVRHVALLAERGPKIDEEKKTENEINRRHLSTN